LILKCLFESWDKSVVSCCQTASTYYMHIVINCKTSNFFRCLEKTSNIHIET
jgi:hypothetical protein